FFENSITLFQTLFMSLLRHASNQIACYVAIYILRSFSFFSCSYHPIYICTELVLHVVRLCNVTFDINSLMAHIHSILERFPVKLLWRFMTSIANDFSVFVD